MEAKIQGNITKYYLYQFFSSLEFWAPIIVLFWRSRGLSMTQIMVLQSLYGIGVIILELPTGAIADYFGKRISLILGAFSWTIGLLVYSLCFRFWQFFIAEMVVAVGSALISGADRAFIYENLKSLGQEKKYQTVEGRARALTEVGRTLARLGGGLVASVSFSLTLVIHAVFTFIGFLISLSFAETKITLPRKEQTEYLQIIKDSLNIVRMKKEVLWLVAFFAIFNSLIQITNWFSQPYLQMLNVPIVYFGVIFAFFSLFSVIAASFTHQFAKITRGQAFSLLSLLACASMFLVARLPSVCILPLWSLFGALGAMNRILVSDQVLGLVPSERAATILSFQNLLRRLVYVVFGPLLGYLSDSFGLLSALQVNAAVLSVLLTVLFWGRGKLTQVWGD
jgi:MFS family permease